MNRQLHRPAYSRVIKRGIHRVIKSYQKHGKTFKDHEDTELFVAHHKACKIALSHLELLMKFADKFESEEDLSFLPIIEIEQAKENILPHAEEYNNHEKLSK